MKTLELYVKPAGTTVNLKLKPDAKVTTYVVFLDEWTNTGSKPVQTFHPHELESKNGVTFPLGNAKGYDIIIKAQISAAANMTPNLSFNGVSTYTTDIDLPTAEGPVVVREWSIIIK